MALESSQDIVEENVGLPSGFEFTVILLLDWLLTNTRESSLPYYFTHNWWIPKENHIIFLKIEKDIFFLLILRF